MQKQQLVDYNNSIVNVKRETLVCERERKRHKTHRYTSTWKGKEVERENVKKANKLKNESSGTNRFSLSLYIKRQEISEFLFSLFRTQSQTHTHTLTRTCSHIKIECVCIN